MLNNKKIMFTFMLNNDTKTNTRNNVKDTNRSYQNVNK